MGMVVLVLVLQGVLVKKKCLVPDHETLRTTIDLSSCNLNALRALILHRATALLGWNPSVASLTLRVKWKVFSPDM